MIKFQSIRSKVILYVFVTSVFMMFMFGSLVFFQVESLTQNIFRNNLVNQAKRIASYLEYGWTGRLELDLTDADIHYYKNNSFDHQYAVMNAEGKKLFSSKNFMGDKIKEARGKGGQYFFTFSVNDGDVFTGLKYDYLFEGKIYPIYVIENDVVFSQFLSTLKKGFNQNIFTFGLPLLFLQGLMIIFLFRNALAPIQKASEEARNIKYNNLSFRLENDNFPSEIVPLITSVNESLARLEKSAETQKMFIANAAHEIRTPISILKARISSLKDEKEIFILNQDLRDINRLISQMLDVSRLDTIENPIMEEICLNTLVRKTCQDIGPLFITQEKELSLEEKSEKQMIMGNEDILSRALMNLLENALKYSPEKTPVKVIVEEKQIIVRDFGQPIDALYRDKIFDRFEKSPKDLGEKGSGLGLAIVRKAADLHGGTVVLESRHDGNDFIVNLK